MPPLDRLLCAFAFLPLSLAVGCGGATDPGVTRAGTPAPFEAPTIATADVVLQGKDPALSEVPAAAPEPPAPEVPRAELLSACDEVRSIVIHKAARTLELRCGDALAARFSASLGSAPEGHKEREGDGKTPEGEYFISMKFPSQFHMSLQIAYPNVADADAGLARGTISKSQHAAVVRAYDTCREPPQTTPLGSLLQIHGGGGGPDVGDWTLGCVAVDNAEIEVVFAFHRPGCDASGKPHTRVLITP